MESKQQKLIVPWDFTPVAENALLYAFKIGAFFENYCIHLIYVVESAGFFSKGKMTQEEAAEKLKVDATRIKEEHGIEVKTFVQEGNLFYTINEHAFDVGAAFVIMGTHGIKGVQKLTGSRALKVIAGSNVPYLVIQDAPQSEQIFQNIVFPLDFRASAKEGLPWAIKAANQFNSHIHIFMPHATDSGIQKKLNGNLTVAKRHFETNNVEFSVHSAVKGGNYASEVVKLSVELEADLILIMTTPNLDFTDYIFGAQEQYIIANNAKLPVMCINPAMI